MEDSSIQKLKRIYQTVKKLKERSDKLEQENKELRETVLNHLQAIDELRKQVKVSNTELNAAQAAQYIEDNAAIRKELDQYIKLIDKTIAAIQVK